MRWVQWVFVGVQLVLLFYLSKIVFRLGLMAFGMRLALPYVPSAQSVMRTVSRSGLLDNATEVIDLGCGNGTMIAALRPKYPRIQFRGVEWGRLLAFIARVRFFAHRKTVSITRGDMFQAPIDTADVIIGFWISSYTGRLLGKFERECKPGCIIISNMFPLPASTRVVPVPFDGGKDKIFVYRKV